MLYYPLDKEMVNEETIELNKFSVEDSVLYTLKVIPPRKNSRVEFVIFLANQEMPECKGVEKIKPDKLIKGYYWFKL